MKRASEGREKSRFEEKDKQRDEIRGRVEKCFRVSLCSSLFF